MNFPKAELYWPKKKIKQAKVNFKVTVLFAENYFYKVLTNVSQKYALLNGVLPSMCLTNN